MGLSSDLISQFVKATKDTEETSKESKVNGTIVEYNGSKYVRLDGSELLTPISTTVAVDEGERVTVTIKDHTATVDGNTSSPSAKDKDVQNIGSKITEFEIVVADKISTKELEAVNATIDNLVSENVTIKNKLTANEASIKELEAGKLSADEADIKFATIDSLTAAKAEIENLKTNKLDAEIADITYATIKSLEATDAKIYNLESTYGDFKDLTTEKFTAITADIDELEANKLSATEADLKYANIDFSNIGKAAIEHFYATSGLIKDVVVGDGTITGELVGVTIKGDLIEGGTVVADKLVIKGTDGLYYKLNTDGETVESEQTEYNSLDGKHILAKSITATKVNVKDLVAFGATIGGFNITDESLYSGVKETVDNTTRGIYMDKNGQLAIGDSSNYLKFYKDQNGNYRLELSANSLRFSASNKTVETVINETLDDIKIGGRNLIRNSDDLIFNDYVFEESASLLAVTYDGAGNTLVESNAISATDSEDGDAAINSAILEASDDGAGNVALTSNYDVETEETSEMKTLTIGGIKFKVVDEQARLNLLNTIGAIDDLLTDDKTNIVAAINEIYKTGGIGTGGGTGGGSSNAAVITLTNTSGWLAKTVSYQASCLINFTWSSLENDLETGDGVLKITVNGIVKSTSNISQGAVSIDIGSYLSLGSNSVKVNVVDVYGNSRTINYTVNTVSVSLTSTFDATIPYDSSIAFTYTPTGSVSKTMHFILDGKEIGTEIVTTSGRQKTYTIPAQSHGSHSLSVYFDAEIDGQTIQSNILYYELICIVSGNNDPIITSNFNKITATQYETLTISYIVYNPANLVTDVVLKVNDSAISEQTVDRSTQVWTYRPSDVGNVTLEIVAGKTVKTFTLEVSESDISAEAETENLALYLSSYGRNNNEADPSIWEYNDISVDFTNFNFTSDGWQTDDDGITVLRVSGDARLTIPYQIFAKDFRTSGKTIEVEFATKDVLNYDTVIFSCFTENRGIQITPQAVTLKSQLSEISRQYKEDEHVRISFVVEKRSESPLIYCYIDGICSGVVKYPDDDDFSQTNPVNISIGSNDCTIDLYCIRVYDNNLNRYQILDNWIADTQIIDDMLERYERNSIYDEYGQVVVSRLPKDLPYMVLEASELPQSKGDKKTISGYYVDPLNDNKSFTFTGASCDVQGTSSQYYRRKNYKIKFSKGFVINGVTQPTYQMRDDSIGVKTFTFKADVASSEGANNVELVRLYNDICPYKTPPQLENENVRQGIDGFPIVMFWNNGTETTFLGKYNFNNDKGTEEVFGFDSGDESWEIRNNTSDRSLFKSDDFSGTGWLEDFEGRYPDGNTDPTNLKSLSSWLVSTDQSQATGNTLSSTVAYDGVTYTKDTAAYRLAKFKAEADSWLEVDGIIFNYIFTELFLMVDSRAKNAFPTKYVNGKWCILPYDYDTALGINNEGLLVFGYSLEDIDTVNGSNVYNGQNSVLYINIRDAFQDRISEMYKSLRADRLLTYDDTEQRFEDHQALWPEAIFNEDAYFKYIQPLIDDGEAVYLSMCQGSKESQRKWWLYNRYRYIDSKYTTGDALSQTITLRSYQKSNFTITPYADIYACVAFDSTLVKARATRNEECSIISPATWDPNGSDAVVTVYSADQLKDIGDLAPFKVGYADFSKGIKLQSIKVGDASSSYSNENLTELHVGNNTLLRKVDVRNCPNLSTAIDLSDCPNIEEGYFDGTSVTSVSLPNGGILKKLHLPETITALTIRNQKMLTDFVLPSSVNISTLRLENVSSVINVISMLNSIASGSRVRIIGFDWTFDSSTEILTFYDTLDTMRGLDENHNNVDDAQMLGTIRVDSVTGSELSTMQTKYPSINIVYAHISSYLYYYNEDGSRLLYTETVIDGGNGVYSVQPSKDSTAQYHYTFVGWGLTPNGIVDANALNGVTADRKVYASYTSTVRTYTVYFYNGATVLQTVANVPYGGSASYTGSTPEKGEEDYEFTGWSPTPTNIIGDTYCYAQYKYTGLTSVKLVERTLSGDYVNNIVETVGTYAFYGCQALTSIDLPNVTSIGTRVFSSCEALTSVNLPNVTSIGEDAFSSCKALTSIDLPNVTSIGTNGFYGCQALTSIDLPNVTSIGYGIFQNCTALTSVNIPNVTSIGTYAFYGCQALTSIDLPNVTSIGVQSFSWCRALTSIVLRSETLVKLYNTNVFSITPIESGTGYIYVPSTLVESYKADSKWSTYANQIRALEDYTVDGTISGKLDESKI